MTYKVQNKINNVKNVQMKNTDKEKEKKKGIAILEKLRWQAHHDRVYPVAAPITRGRRKSDKKTLQKLVFLRATCCGRVRVGKERASESYWHEGTFAW